ncbi:hypothetical protein AwDysgo_00540 [Bacteroidales bacterium]|nr:hypothetical protein AwDysgo_00540 [Bacteroidales bacterium]
MKIHAKITAVMMCLFLHIVILKGQENLEISKIFSEFGKLEGSTLVQLGTDVLDKNTKINFYKSLALPRTSEAEIRIDMALEIDCLNGEKIVESKKNGMVETAYYVLVKERGNGEYRYVLYKNKSKKIYLIYLKGDFPPQELEAELEKLKDLFIFVNKKRIKL